MRNKAVAAAWLVAAGLGMLARSTPARAQDSPKSGGGGRFTVAGEVGARLFTKEPDSLHKGKFEEYRDLRAGLVAEQLRLGYTPTDSFGSYSLTMRKLFDRDQSMWLQAKRPGNYDFQVRWDRIPHTYSTTARSPGVENDPGFNTLPVPRPDSLAWRNAPYIGTVRSQWDPVKVSLALTPTDALDSRIEYRRIGKSGGIPMGLSFSGSAGPQREFVAPVDQTVHDLRLSQGYASADRGEGGSPSFIRSYQLVATYEYSAFRNDIKSALVDNPQNSVSSFANGAATGRVSFAPDNAAQTATVTGAVLLPARTRLMGTVSGSWMSQNDRFLPQTSNDSLARDPNYALTTLPRTSLDGRVRTSLVTLSANSRPLDRLTLAARYRNFDRTDRSAPFHLAALIVSDRTVTPADSETREPNPYTKANTEFTASYQIARSLSLTAGYALEDWTRDLDVRNTAKTKEQGPRASLDYNGVEWLSLHASHSSSTRRGDQYVEAASELAGFRRFDLSDRDRTRISLLATVTPVPSLDLSFSYQAGDDKFPNSPYGTQSDKSVLRGIDLGWSVGSRFTVSGGYSRENVDNVLNMRFRTGAAGSPTFDNPTYRWTNTNTDRSTTSYVALTTTLVPDKLDLAASLSSVDGHFWVYNVNPTPPAGGTAAQNLSATAENWPEVSQSYTPLTLSLRYRYSEDWALTTRYQAEWFTQADFRTAMPLFAPFNGQPGLLPGAIGTVTGSNTGQYHFLSNAYLPFTANYFTLLVSYRPGAIPFARGRSTF